MAIPFSPSYQVRRVRCWDRFSPGRRLSQPVQRGADPGDHGAAVITAISVDVFKTVPPVLKEAAMASAAPPGSRPNVVIPYTRVA